MQSQECVFCSIANKTLASEILFENDDVIVIRDIMPKAPVHLLVMPKQHVESINHLQRDQQALISEIIFTAKEQAMAAGVGESGYKLVFNVGKDGGQVIPHLHLHVLGGKHMEA